MSKLKIPGICALLIALIAIGAQSEEAGKPIPPRMARRAITLFLDNPLSADAEAARELVERFAERNDTVLVITSADHTPWIDNEQDEQEEPAAVLLTAHIAGNVASQLDSGVRADDAYSGWIQVFRTYRFLKKRDKNLRVPAIEELLALHRNGQLMTYAIKLQEKYKNHPQVKAAMQPVRQPE